MVRIRRKLDSETLYLPELKPLIGRTVEITVEEQPPDCTEEFYAEASRLPATQEAFAAQNAVFQRWRHDPRFEPFWPLLVQMLARSFDQVRKWAEASAAVTDLDGHDFDAYRRQRVYDREHAGDHLP